MIYCHDTNHVPTRDGMSHRALITGGAGFVGSHLAERLLRDSYRVTVLDNLATGSIANLDHLLGEEGFTMVNGDVIDPSLVEGLVRESDYVFHLAASVGVKRIVETPIESMLTNIRGTEVVLEAAARWQPSVMIASTSEVYGKSPSVPFNEEDDILLGPSHQLRWSYAASKAIDEYLTLAYFRDERLPATVVRLFNTVGRRQTGRYGMVIPTFVRQALSGLPLTVHGDGSQRRAFAHVSDAVDAMVKLSNLPEARGEVFNVGNDFEISILDLANLVRERAKSDSEILFIPYDRAFRATGFEDIPRRIPDLSKIKQFISYEPAWSIEAIIDDVVGFFREQPGFR